MSFQAFQRERDQFVWHGCSEEHKQSINSDKTRYSFTLPWCQSVCFTSSRSLSSWLPDSQVRYREIRNELVFSHPYLSYDSSKPYAVGTQKNRLIDTILLSTHNIGFWSQVMIWRCENKKLFSYLELCGMK